MNTRTITFKNIQHIDHMIELVDMDKYYQTQLYMKLNDLEWKLLSSNKIRKTKIDAHIENQKRITHQLKYHLSIDLLHYNDSSLYVVDFNGKQINIEELHHENYQDIENWIPELTMPFDIHHIQHGFCFSFATIDDRKLMFGVLKKYFDESLYDIYILDNN